MRCTDDTPEGSGTLVHAEGSSELYRNVRNILHSNQIGDLIFCSPFIRWSHHQFLSLTSPFLPFLAALCISFLLPRKLEVPFLPLLPLFNISAFRSHPQHNAVLQVSPGHTAEPALRHPHFSFMGLVTAAIHCSVIITSYLSCLLGL